MDTFTLIADATVETNSSAGTHAHAFKAGVITPTDEHEERALNLLVDAGVATSGAAVAAVAAVAKPKRTRRTPTVQTTEESAAASKSEE